MVAKIDSLTEARNAAREARYLSPEWQATLNWDRYFHLTAQIWLIGGIVLMGVALLASRLIDYIGIEQVSPIDLILLTVFIITGIGMLVFGIRIEFQTRRTEDRRKRELEEEISMRLNKRRLQDA